MLTHSAINFDRTTTVRALMPVKQKKTHWIAKRPPNFRSPFHPTTNPLCTLVAYSDRHICPPPSRYYINNNHVARGAVRPRAPKARSARRRQGLCRPSPPGLPVSFSCIYFSCFRFALGSVVSERRKCAHGESANDLRYRTKHQVRWYTGRIDTCLIPMSTLLRHITCLK